MPVAVNKPLGAARLPHASDSGSCCVWMAGLAPDFLLLPFCLVEVGAALLGHIPSTRWDLTSP